MKQKSIFKVIHPSTQQRVDARMQKVHQNLAEHIPDLADSKAYRIINKDLYFKICKDIQYIADHGSEAQQLAHYLGLWQFYLKIKILIEEGLEDQTNLGLCTSFIKYFNKSCNNIFDGLQAQLVTLSQIIVATSLMLHP